jgi:uncharacterized protein
MLKDLEAKTTAQMVVLTVNSLEGEPIADFSHQTAVKWGIGQKGKDNGVLITVAVKDRKYRIEVGYGLEGALPDSLVGSIGRQYLAPHFRKGDFAGGLVAAATAISNKIVGGAGAKDGPQNKEEEGLNWIILLLIILSVIAVPIILIWWLARKLKTRGASDYDGGFWGGGWSSGGWSSGGGDSGGFSGGGGDFGGGGASGDW